MGEFAAGGPAEQPVRPTGLAVKMPKFSVWPSELRRLLTTFGYLVAKQGATAVLGLAYWAVTTHLFSARDVGLAAAASSAAFFLAAIGALGIPLLLLAELESLVPAARRVALSTGMLIACLAVLILSLATLALSPFLGDSLSVIGHDSATAAFLVIGSVATVGGLTLDNAAIRLHRGSVQLARGTLNSALKLAVVGVLVLAGTRTASGLLFAWALALVVSLAVSAPMLRLQPAPAGQGSLSHRVALARRYGAHSLKHHVLNLSINSIGYLVALIAALLIRPQQLAYFSTAFLLSSTAMIIPYLLALSLFAEMSGDQSLLHRHVRRTLPLGLALCAAILVIVAAAAPLVLRVFGSAYAANGTTALRLLLLLGPAYVIKDHYVAIRRTQGRLGQAAKVMAAGSSAEALGAAFGGIYWGTTGLCIGWAVAASFEAIVLLPAVLRVFRRDPAPETHRPPSRRRWAPDGEPLLRRRARALLKRLARSVVRARADERRIVLIFGCQRSGTTMIQQTYLDRSWRVLILEEHDRRLVGPAAGREETAWQEYSTVLGRIRRLPFEVVAAKPLVESGSAAVLMDAAHPVKAVWMLRHYSRVAQSNVSRFGPDNPYRDLQPIRSRDPLDWRYRGATEETWETVNGLLDRKLTPFDAAALFWWTRNQLYFDQRLWEDDRIRILRYERACNQPAEVITSLSDHIGMALPLHLIAPRVRAQPLPPPSGELDPDIEQLCNKLWNSFEGCPEL